MESVSLGEILLLCGNKTRKLEMRCEEDYPTNILTRHKNMSNPHKTCIF